MLILLSWWILVNVYTVTTDEIPRALGPYPSADMCRQAGKSRMPDDDRFLTTADKTARQKKWDRVNKEADQAKVGVRTQLSDGTSILKQVHGPTMYSGGGGRIGPRYQALSDCVKIESASPRDE